MCVKPRKSNVSGFPRPRAARLPDGAPPELDQPGLVRVQLQPELREPAREARSGTARASSSCSNPTMKSSAKRTMITSPCAVAVPPPIGPQVEDVVQVHVGEQRRYRCSLRCPRSVCDQIPSSTTPAASHLSISRRTLGSAIRCRRNLLSQSDQADRRSRGYPRPAPSSPLAMIPAPARPARHAAFEPGQNPYESPEIRLVDVKEAVARYASTRPRLDAISPHALTAASPAPAVIPEPGGPGDSNRADPPADERQSGQRPVARARQGTAGRP